MRGLKPKKANVNLFPGWSHLLQMRGLKPFGICQLQRTHMSHLLQMRGLKQICHRIKRGSRRVASFTDAWIETLFFVNTQEE